MYIAKYRNGGAREVGKGSRECDLVLAVLGCRDSCRNRVRAGSIQYT